jgi:hypothetical protein
MSCNGLLLSESGMRRTATAWLVLVRDTGARRKPGAGRALCMLRLARCVHARPWPRGRWVRRVAVVSCELRYDLDEPHPACHVHGGGRHDGPLRVQRPMIAVCPTLATVPSSTSSPHGAFCCSRLLLSREDLSSHQESRQQEETPHQVNQILAKLPHGETPESKNCRHGIIAS